MQKSLHGGLWLELNKKAVVSRPVEPLPAPVRLIFPMLQQEGEPASVCVKKGQRVLMGQPLGVDGNDLSCSVHSSVSGKVSDIIEYKHPVIGSCPAVVVDNDGKDTPCEKTAGEHDYTKMSPQQIFALLRGAGIVSDSIPAVPLWLKLMYMKKEKIETLIINSVETEPYICRSQKILDENPQEIAQGLYCMMKCTGAKKAVLAVSGDYRKEPEDVLKSAHLMGCEVKLVRVPEKYPSGNEQFLFEILFRKRLAEGQSPANAGAGFIYAEDCLYVARVLSKGEPQITKIVTVAGDAVEDPQNLEIRLGTEIQEVFDHVGLSCEPERAVLGSSMRGFAIATLSIPVIKSVSSILALKGAGHRAVTPRCVSCGKCVQVCPQRLLPNYLALYSVKANFEKCRELCIEKCIECGSCAYICPGKVPIVELIKNIKKAGQEKQAGWEGYR